VGNFLTTLTSKQAPIFMKCIKQKYNIRFQSNRVKKLAILNNFNKKVFLLILTLKKKIKINKFKFS